MQHHDKGDELARIPSSDAVEHVRKWAEEIEDGATIRVCVPDFSHAVDAYAKGGDGIETRLLANGEYRSIWNREKLSKTLNYGGFEIVGGSAEDGAWASADGWLEVVARKCMRPAPRFPMSDIHCIMSLPRICWTDTMGALHEVGAQLGFSVTRATGVFWGQCLERLMEQAVESGKGYKYVLTVDYDSVFDANDVVRLWQVMESHPEIAALCPVQIGRDRDHMLVSVMKDGKLLRSVSEDTFHTDALDVYTGHFGLTLIRVESLVDLPHPWFLGVPGPDGRWDKGRTDDDIHFWHRLREAGKRICLCPKVRVGHIQNIVTWPGERMQTIHQYLTRYHEDGRPDECMTF